jgi:hypothetical protein
MILFAPMGMLSVCEFHANALQIKTHGNRGQVRGEGGIMERAEPALLQATW